MNFRLDRAVSRIWAAIHTETREPGDHSESAPGAARGAPRPRAPLPFSAFLHTTPTLGILITGLVLVVRQFGGLETLEIGAFDMMTRWRPDAPPDDRLLVVGVTEADIQAAKKWPLSDEEVAAALGKLSAHQPAAIGLDLYRNFVLEPGHTDLVQQLQAENIIAIQKLPDADSLGVPPPNSVPPERVGFNDMVVDPDGTIRRNLLSFQIEPGVTYSSFALRLALLYLQRSGISPQSHPNHPGQIRLGKAVFSPLQANSGGYQTIENKGYQILLNYRSRDNGAKTITLSQLLTGDFDPNWVKGKIVLIGTTAPSGKDLFFTPYSRTDREKAHTPGVILHAQMVSQLLTAAADSPQGVLLPARGLFWFWPEWLELLWVVGWGLMGVLVVFARVQPLTLGIAICALAVAIAGISFGLFLLGGWVPVVAPLLAFMANSSAVLTAKAVYGVFYDRLTNLPNRASFMQYLRRRQRGGRVGKRRRRGDGETGTLRQAQEGDGETGRGGRMVASPSSPSLHPSPPNQVAVLILDLDRFQMVNEGLGHEVGDRLLIAFADRLRTAVTLYCSSNTPIARVGADEFAILLENIESVNFATTIAAQLRHHLAIPFHLQELEIFTTVSIGIAVGEVGEPRDLLRDANTAMYRAKVSGKPTPELFETAMQARSIARFQTETDLRRALKSAPKDYADFAGVVDSEFLVYYQPLVYLPTGRIAGFEALARWGHPTKGLVFPGDFIPVAEETGAIVPLGELVLYKACQQMRQWQQQFPQMQAPQMISVNLSGKQFTQPDLIERIEYIIKTTELPPQSLKLEITESVAMDNVEATIALLNRLKELHIKLGIDDFGTGYSSLSYLTQFLSLIHISQGIVR